LQAAGLQLGAVLQSQSCLCELLRCTKKIFRLSANVPDDAAQVDLDLLQIARQRLQRWSKLLHVERLRQIARGDVARKQFGTPQTAENARMKPGKRGDIAHQQNAQGPAPSQRTACTQRKRQHGQYHHRKQ